MGKKLGFFHSTINPSPLLADNIIHPLDLNLAYTVIKRIDKVIQSTQFCTFLFKFRINLAN